MEPGAVPNLPEGVAERLRETGVESLYPPQAAAVEAGLTEGKNLVASVPTASGKTLIAELAMLSAIADGGTALYVVPLRALASEKAAEFERWEDLGFDVAVSTGNYEESGEWLASADVVVATSEKVDSLVRNGAPWLENLRCVVADEVHLVDDASRGPTLEVTLAKLRRINPGLQVVALSATVGNADEVADWLDADLVDAEWRPIDLRTGVHYGNAITFADGDQREVRVENGQKQTAALVDDALTDETPTPIRDLRLPKSARRLSKMVGPIGDTVSSTDIGATMMHTSEILENSMRAEFFNPNSSNDSYGFPIARVWFNTESNLLSMLDAFETELRDISNQLSTGSDRVANRIRENSTNKVEEQLAHAVEIGVLFDHTKLSHEVKSIVEADLTRRNISHLLISPKAAGEQYGITRSDDPLYIEGGSSLVFVNSRRNAEAAARRLGSVTERHLTDEERDALADLAAAVREVSDTETSDDLADCVERGAAFHHAGLAGEHRSLVEDAFRDRLLKCICATPTLAAGVNTPARRVIVRDWRRYDGEFGGMKPLDALEVHQMMGRAGRPGLDPYGEAVLLAKDADTRDELFDRYVWADPEPVRSKLAAEPALRTHLLATVASGFARTRDGLLEFLDETLYATQADDDAHLASVADRVIEYLVANDFLERDGDDLSATGVGHTVSRLYLDPMSAAEIVDGLRWADDHRAEGVRALAGDGGGGDPGARNGNGSGTADVADDEANGFRPASELRSENGDVGDEETADDEATDDEATDDPAVTYPTALGLYHLVSRTPDTYPLYLKSGDRETYTEICFEREPELLGRTPSEYDDVAFEEWLSALKTARMLEDWADEVDEDRITERYGIGPGDVRGKVDTAEWLLGAAETLAGELDLPVVPVREARMRVQYGVREELLDLAGVRNVGRKRARRLFEAGIESRADLREADKATVLGAVRGRRKTAETILENAGRRDPSMDGVDADGGAGDGGGAQTAGRGRSDTARGTGDAVREDDETQASLGDFE